jgi:DNA-binding NarL/FixJ family response regulator
LAIRCFLTSELIGSTAAPVVRNRIETDVSPRTPATTPADVRVVIVDDGRLNRECLEAQLWAHDVDAVCAWDLESLLGQMDRGVPNVVLLNITARDSDTLLHVTLDLNPAVRVIVFGLADHRESEIVSCAEAGVAGLHLNSESFEHLLGLIHSANGQAVCSPRVSAILLKRVYAFARQGDPELKEPLLSPREKQILELLEAGLSNQQIASRLCLTLHTVKNHVHSVLTKLGVSTRSEAGTLYHAMRYSASVQQSRNQEIPRSSSA